MRRIRLVGGPAGESDVCAGRGLWAPSGVERVVGVVGVMWGGRSSEVFVGVLVLEWCSVVLAVGCRFGGLWTSGPAAGVVWII